MPNLYVALVVISCLFSIIASEINNKIAAPALCGGSIISSTFILTAAHCCIWQKEFEIGIGTNFLGLPLFRRRTNRRIIHAAYDPETYQNDIALIPMRRITFNRYAQPIKLPSISNVGKLFTNEKVIITGWGKLSNNTIPRNMQYKTFRVISNTECSEIFYNIFQTTLCGVKWPESGNQVSCKGDSGGPVSYTTLNDGIIQVGIVSFGARDGCDKNYPVGFTRITSYLAWISRKTRINFE